MSVGSLINRIQSEMAAGTIIDWRQLRKEIIEEHKSAANTKDRVALLAIYKAVMDAVERQSLVSDLAAFQKARNQDYSLLLVSEAMIGVTDGNVNADKLLEVTSREVAAGRLDRNDELHRLALGGLAQFKPKAQGLLSKFRSVLGR